MDRPTMGNVYRIIGVRMQHLHPRYTAVLGEHEWPVSGSVCDGVWRIDVGRRPLRGATCALHQFPHRRPQYPVVHFVWVYFVHHYVLEPGCECQEPLSAWAVSNYLELWIGKTLAKNGMEASKETLRLFRQCYVHCDWVRYMWLSLYIAY